MGADAQAIFYGLALVTLGLVVVGELLAKHALTALGFIALGIALAIFVNFYNALSA